MNKTQTSYYYTQDCRQRQPTAHISIQDLTMISSTSTYPLTKQYSSQFQENSIFTQFVSRTFFDPPSSYSSTFQSPRAQLLHLKQLSYIALVFEPTPILTPYPQSSFPFPSPLPHPYHQYRISHQSQREQDHEERKIETVGAQRHGFSHGAVGCETSRRHDGREKGILCGRAPADL